jgi:hypothetical protein
VFSHLRHTFGPCVFPFETCSDRVFSSEAPRFCLSLSFLLVFTRAVLSNAHIFSGRMVSLMCLVFSSSVMDRVSFSFSSSVLFSAMRDHVLDALCSMRLIVQKCLLLLNAIKQSTGLQLASASSTGAAVALEHRRDTHVRHNRCVGQGSVRQIAKEKSAVVPRLGANRRRGPVLRALPGNSNRMWHIDTQNAGHTAPARRGT